MPRHHLKWFALTGLILPVSGCVLTEPPVEETTAATAQELAGAEPAGWVAIEPGVWTAVDGATTRWRFQGRAGHEWFRAELVSRLQETADRADRAYYQKLLQHISDTEPEWIDASEEGPGLESQTASVDISEITNGLRAYAYAHRGTGTIRVETEVRINGLTDADSDSKTCVIFGCSTSVTSQKSAANPSTCFASAYASAGSTIDFAEHDDCPPLPEPPPPEPPQPPPPKPCLYPTSLRSSLSAPGFIPICPI